MKILVRFDRWLHFNLIFRCRQSTKKYARNRRRAWNVARLRVNTMSWCSIFGYLLDSLWVVKSAQWCNSSNALVQFHRRCNCRQRKTFTSIQLKTRNQLKLFCFQLQIAAFITAPFDVVKTHKQIEFGDKVLYAEHPSKSYPSTSTVDVIRKIYRSNGVRGLFAGVTPRVIKIAPACAIMITSFEYGKAFFFNQNVKTYQKKHLQS